MMKSVLSQAIVITACFALFFQAGCAGRSQSSRFYVLDPVASGIEKKTAVGGGNGFSVFIGPVSIPKYLKKPQIVTRTGGNELLLAEYNRWAGRMEEDIGRVVAENLSRLLATDRVLAYPAMAPGEPDYSITMDISRFDGVLGDAVELIARWAVFDGQGNDLYGIRSSRIIEPIQGAGYADMVAAQSRALASFSRELADAIMQLTGGQY